MSSPFSAHSPLPEGFVLDVYCFERVLGSPGAFGTTYAARDTKAGTRLAIKELFPRDLVMRDTDLLVHPQSAEEAGYFQDAMRMFRHEADVLSQVKHENVVRVLDYFEANGTGYMVMEYQEGYDLSRHFTMQKPGRLNENELRKLILPLLDGLEAVHAHNYLHRDIKPTNIYLTRGHRPLLLDFGAARQMVVSRSRPVTTILTAPFAPFEQYGTSIPQGPWTDIYAMGCVMFEALVSVDELPPSPNRLGEDTLVPLSHRLRGQEYSDDLLAAIDWSLQVNPQDRPQTIAAWREVLHGKASPPKPLSVPINQGSPVPALPTAADEAKRRRTMWIVVGVGVLFFFFLFVIAAVVAAIWYFHR